MIQKYKYKNVLWVNAEAPTTEELESLINEHSLSNQIKNALSATNGSQFYNEHQTSFIAIEFPNYAKNVASRLRLQCIVTPSVLITMHKESNVHIDELLRDFELSALSESLTPNDLTHVLLTELIKKHYSQSLAQLKNMSEDASYLHRDISALLTVQGHHVVSKNSIATHSAHFDSLHEIYANENYSKIVELNKALTLAHETFASILENAYLYILADFTAKFNKRIFIVKSLSLAVIFGLLLLSFLYFK
jgi:hypothetical protein